MTRQRIHASDAERQRAYRERQARQALRLEDRDRQDGDDRRAVGLPGGAGSECSVTCEHTAAAGLLVRVVRSLDERRVLAAVQAPGTSGLTVGWAYPFRIDWLREV